MVVENAHALHGDSAAAAEVADELVGACVDLENFFDHVALEVAAAGGGVAKGEEEDLEWLSNKDAFPAVETMLPAAAAPRPQEKGAPRPRRVVAKAAVAGRRCRHCGTEETPQWREGPSGRATLCNACGLRYRSGRLVPEYRPAGSPNFSRELHSNIHRRVVEMRRLREAAAMASPAPPSRPPSREVKGGCLRD